jgi:hypothetical protein
MLSGSSKLYVAIMGHSLIVWTGPWFESRTRWNKVNYLILIEKKVWILINQCSWLPIIGLNTHLQKILEAWFLGKTSLWIRITSNTWLASSLIRALVFAPTLPFHPPPPPPPTPFALRAAFLFNVELKCKITRIIPYTYVHMYMYDCYC